jgi:hypothetical protein
MIAVGAAMDAPLHHHLDALARVADFEPAMKDFFLPKGKILAAPRIST